MLSHLGSGGSRAPFRLWQRAGSGNDSLSSSMADGPAMATAATAAMGFRPKSNILRIQGLSLKYSQYWVNIVH